MEATLPGKVLVLGSCSGYLEAFLSDSISVTTVDIFSNVIEKARRVNQVKANRDFKLVEAQQLYTLNELIPAASFDCAVVCMVEHYEKELDGLRAIAARMNPTDTMLLMLSNAHRFQNLLRQQPRKMSNHHLQEYTQASARKVVQNAGLTVKRVTSVDF